MKRVDLDQRFKTLLLLLSLSLLGMQDVNDHLSRIIY
jgi:hypothetical protein